MDKYDDREVEIDIRDLFSKITDNFSTLLSVLFITLFGAILYLYFSKPIYSSSVIMALDNQGNSKLEGMLSEKLFQSDKANEVLKLTEVTLQSKKFIDTIIDKVSMARELLVENNFKKTKVSQFSDIQFDVTYHDDSLYGVYFEIEPIDSQKFLLRVDEIDFAEICLYNDEIKNEFFTLRVTKTGRNNLIETSKINKLLIKFGLDKSTFVKRVVDFDKSYYFRLFDRDKQLDMLIKNMKVSELSENILKIEYHDNIASRAKDIVSQIAKSYIDYTLENKTSELGQTLSFLDKQIVDIKSNLKSRGDELTAHQQKSGTAVISSAEDILKNLQKKEERIEQISLQIQEIKKFKRAMKMGVLSTVSLISAGIDTSSISSLIETYRLNSKEIEELRFQQKNIGKTISSNDQINALIVESKEKEFYIQNLLTSFTAEHPQVIEKQQELDSLRDKIHATIMASIEGLQKIKTISGSNIINNMSMVENNLKNRLRVLKSNILEKKALLQELPEKYMVNENLKRKFTLSGDIYTFLLQKKIEVEISKASIIANTKILENAYIAKKPIKPNRVLILLISVVIGFILGLIYIFSREFFNSKIRGIRDVIKITDIPIYGVLGLKENDRFFEEALRNIRTNLQFVLSEDKKCTTILISSTVPKEGKTTISAGLAEIIAGADKKVLVMDLDLRKPKLYKELKTSNRFGMSNYLTSHLTPEDVIRPISENLDFFPAGSVPPNPSELLMSQKFNETIRVLEKEYDYIIFDTAPIGVVTDTNMLLRYTDILLLVIRANRGDKSYIENFKRMIEEKKIKSSGIILNGVKFINNKSYGYGYGYGYGSYGYNYGKAE